MLFTDCGASSVGENKFTLVLVFTFSLFLPNFSSINCVSLALFLSQLDIFPLLIYDGYEQHVLRVNSVEHSG